MGKIARRAHEFIERLEAAVIDAYPTCEEHFYALDRPWTQVTLAVIRKRFWRVMDIADPVCTVVCSVLEWVVVLILFVTIALLTLPVWLTWGIARSIYEARLRRCIRGDKRFQELREQYEQKTGAAK